MIEFLLSLMNDPLELDAFKRNPDAIIQRYSLSEEEVAAIRSGNIEAISMRLAAAGQDQRAFIAKEHATANVRNKPRVRQGKHGHHR